jgi:urea transport system substrate-binding protein
MDFESRYVRRFGADAPTLNSPGESCYEGLTLLTRIAQRAGTLELPEMCGVADDVAYDGPRGSVRLRGNHLQQRIYLARAVGLEFDVLVELSSGP